MTITMRCFLYVPVIIENRSKKQSNDACEIYFYQIVLQFEVTRLCFFRLVSFIKCVLMFSLCCLQLLIIENRSKKTKQRRVLK